MLCMQNYKSHCQVLPNSTSISMRTFNAAKIFQQHDECKIQKSLKSIFRIQRSSIYSLCGLIGSTKQRNGEVGRRQWLKAYERNRIQVQLIVMEVMIEKYKMRILIYKLNKKFSITKCCNEVKIYIDEGC